LASGREFIRELLKVRILEDYTSNPALELAPVLRDGWVGQNSAIVSGLQLLV
jgi:hypothetical protein